jgi:hypothetical protein
MLVLATSKETPMFRTVLVYSSTASRYPSPFLSDCLNMTATRYVQTSVIIYQSTSSNNIKNLNIQQRAVRSANLACNSVLSVHYSLLTLTLNSSVRTTLDYNNAKCSFMTLCWQNSSYLTGNTQSPFQNRSVNVV